MLDDMVWYRSTKIALYGPSGGTGIFFRQVLMLFECSVLPEHLAEPPVLGTFAFVARQDF